MFLGSIPKNRILFYIPDAIFYAGRIKKATYGLDTLLFQEQFQLSHKNRLKSVK